MRWKSLSWLCRIWNSQCAISTCGLPRSLQNTVAASMALYPSEFNFPNRAALLISDMTASLPFVPQSLSVGLLPQLRARLRLVLRSRFVGARFRPRLHLPVRQRPALRVRIVRGVPVGEPRPEPGGPAHPHRVAEP